MLRCGYSRVRSACAPLRRYYCSLMLHCQLDIPVPTTTLGINDQRVDMVQQVVLTKFESVCFGLHRGRTLDVLLFTSKWLAHGESDTSVPVEDSFRSTLHTMARTGAMCLGHAAQLGRD